METNIEAIARRLCINDGLDPDERIAYPRTDGLASARYTQRWVVVSAEVRRHLSIQRAVEECSRISPMNIVVCKCYTETSRALCPDRHVCSKVETQ